MKSHILHLSDIHLGNDIGTVDYKIDDKLGVFRNNLIENRQNNFSILLDYLYNSPIVYDFVIISGDIVHRGQYELSSYFNACILKLIELRKLPSRNRFIVVPGNHDVVIGNEKWKIFKQYLDVQFVKPLLDVNLKFRNCYFQKVNKMLKRNQRSKFISNSEFPFVIDKNRKILIYAFNSCSLCQMNNTVIDGKVENIDIPRIDNLELDCFVHTMQTFKEINSDYNDYLIIAVLHHHVSSFTDFEEIKSFETLSNAGVVKNILIKNGVKLVLHGHKHYPHVCIDTTAGKRGGLSFISGGAICELINKEGVKQGFFDLVYDSEKTDEICERYIELASIRKNYENIQYEKIELPQNRNYTRKRKKIEISFIKNLVYRGLENNFLAFNDLCGWDKRILDRKKIGILGTAFGIILIEMLGDYSKFYIENKMTIINSLYYQRKKNGGFGVLFQNESSIIATCWVAQAFKEAKMWDYYTKTIHALLELKEIRCKEILEDSYENNTFTVAIVMKVLLEYYKIYQCNDVINILNELYDNLKNSYVEDSDGVRWAKNLQKDNEGSIPHTCHVCIALMQYQELFNICDEMLRHILKKAKKWLLDRQNMDFVVERIRHNGMEVVYEHNTITWYIIALIRLGVPAYEEAIISNIGIVLQKFDYENGFWKYNDSYNIWETYDSLIALNEYIISTAEY